MKRVLGKSLKNMGMLMLGVTLVLATSGSESFGEADGLAKPIATLEGGNVFFVAPPPVAPASDQPRPLNEQRSTPDEEQKVQVLAESVVEGDFVDPFEEEGEQVKDPWESFNSSMFTFNHQVDRRVLKPFATGYDHVIPYEVQRSLDRVFDNLRVVPRFINTFAQGKWERAGVVLSRFLLNSTIGIGGLFDVAGEMFDLKDIDFEDMGQTLAIHGVPSGPYVVVPFLEPTTVRDGLGQIVDSFLNPLIYFTPFVVQLGFRGEEVVNDRSLNLQVFEGVEESTVDLYGAVREAYSQRRAQAIKE